MDEFNLIVTDGGLGDLVGALVPVDYIIRQHENVLFHVWVPDYLYSFAKHVFTHGSNFDLFKFSQSSRCKFTIPGRTTEWCTNHSAMRTHPVDYAFHMLADRHVYEIKDKNYLQVRADEIWTEKFELPEKYVVIAASSAEPIKAMPGESVNAVIDFCRRREYIPVFLGKAEAKTGFGKFAIGSKFYEIDFGKGLDLMNKTTVEEAAAVIAGAKAFVGMDGGLMHVAGCTGTPIIAGFTLVDPIHVAPYRTNERYWNFYPVEPDESLPNRYYQTYKSGFQRGDFRNFEGWEDVVRSLRPDKFLTILEKIL